MLVVYFKVVLLLLLVVFNFGYLVPNLISANSDIALGLGVFDLAVSAPLIQYYIKWIKI